jgi:phage-related protein
MCHGFSIGVALAKNTIFYILPFMKDLCFRGSSLDDLREFPAHAAREAGYQMDKVQKVGNLQIGSRWKR